MLSQLPLVGKLFLAVVRAGVKSWRGGQSKKHALFSIRELVGKQPKRVCVCVFMDLPLAKQGNVVGGKVEFFFFQAAT